MKRIALATTTVAVMLAAASSAFAAVNTYDATLSFTGAKGTAKKPAALSFNQTIKVAAATAGNRTGLLKQYTTSVQGATISVAGFPTCTVAKINAAKSDAGCPKKALLATGSIQALLGPGTPFTTASAVGTCNPVLDVWNAGKGKLAYFFVETAAHPCLGGALKTGDTGAWPATYKNSGTTLQMTVPIPTFITQPLGASGNTYGSLTYNQLNWKSQAMNGKYDILSTGCSSAKRAYTFGFSAYLPGQAAESTTLKGSSRCG